MAVALARPAQHAARLTASYRRNHERNWPGLSDRASVNKSSDSGGEGGVIYDKRMGLGMPIVLRASRLRCNADPDPGSIPRSNPKGKPTVSGACDTSNAAWKVAWRFRSRSNCYHIQLLYRISTKSLTAPLRRPAERDYYSFDHGPIHFVQFSTEVNFEAGSDQHAFVIADLAAVDRSKTPWVIAGFHRPYITPTVSWQE